MSIRFENITKRFGSQTVLENISFEVKEGEIFVILGKSGVGKSVTLKLIVGLLKPDSGSILVEDKNIVSYSETELVEIRKKCGMVFQHPALLDSLTVFQNVAFGLKIPAHANKTLLKKTEERVLECLQRVHLNETILHRYPAELSYGMQKRVSIARTLILQPEVLLFDEPTTGLDPITSRAINTLIAELSRTLNVTSLVVSHDIQGALEIADRILVLDGGQVLINADPPTLRKSSEPYVQEFLREVSP